jgi:hypothetical protein
VYEKKNELGERSLNGDVCSNFVVGLAGSVFRLGTTEFLFCYREFSYISVPVTPQNKL